MRSALVSTSFAVAVALFASVACGTFSGADEEEKKVPEDAGTDSGGGVSCTPVVVDPASPQQCSAPFATDPDNCGTCGHRCVDSDCQLGRCVPKELAKVELQHFAIDGKKIYATLGSDLQSADLEAAPPLVFQPLTPIVPVVGTVRRLEAYAGDLYVSTTQLQTIVNLATGIQRGNEHAAKASPNTEGYFFPGATAYYQFKAEGAEKLARIDTATGSVRYKDANSFLPVTRSGDEMFWTEVLNNGVSIWDAFGKVETPIVSVAHEVRAFGASGNEVFVAGNGSVTRGANGVGVEIAKESGSGIAFAVRDDEVIYATERSSPAGVRYAITKVDKCRGGRPIELFDTGSPIHGFMIFGDHLIVATTSGVFKTRR